MNADGSRPSPQLFERCRQPLESLGSHLRLAAKADSKVFGHLEKATRNHGSLIFLAQKPAKGIYRTRLQPWKSNGAKFERWRFEIVACFDKTIVCRAVGVQKHTRACFNTVQICKCDGT